MAPLADECRMRSNLLRSRCGQFSARLCCRLALLWGSGVNSMQMGGCMMSFVLCRMCCTCNTWLCGRGFDLASLPTTSDCAGGAAVRIRASWHGLAQAHAPSRACTVMRHHNQAYLDRVVYFSAGPIRAQRYVPCLASTRAPAFLPVRPVLQHLAPFQTWLTWHPVPRR